MIITETVTIDGKAYIYTHSDLYTIRKKGTNEIYADAMDIQPFTYEETDIPLETQPPTETDMREALGILGVNL